MLDVGGSKSVAVILLQRFAGQVGPFEEDRTPLLEPILQPKIKAELVIDIEVQSTRFGAHLVGMGDIVDPFGTRFDSAPI